MNDFPIDSIEITLTEDDLGHFMNAYLSRPHLKVSDHDFYIDVRNIAQFRVENGDKIAIRPYKNSDNALVQLYLHGSVLGALLHQRATLPFHGSSFEFNGKGITLCGHSGSGKSSVSAAFCQHGAQLISDDISPVQINSSNTVILPIKTRIKLWEDSLRKLQLSSYGLDRIGLEYDKFYLPMANKIAEQQLDHLFILGISNKDAFVVNELTGMDKFNTLHRQIYRREYLKGMPETEKKYFLQLFQLAAKIRVTEVIRPKNCDIYATMNCIRERLLQ
jgi:hypothetical protein